VCVYHGSKSIHSTLTLSRIRHATGLRHAIACRTCRNTLRKLASKVTSSEPQSGQPKTHDGTKRPNPGSSVHSRDSRDKPRHHSRITYKQWSQGLEAIYTLGQGRGQGWHKNKDTPIYRNLYTSPSDSNKRQKMKYTENKTKQQMNNN